MSQSVRQSELFAGNDWQVLYRAFTVINFNATDPPSINRALRTYLQENYSENFNDWIESSEFVAFVDLISWLAGTLAFKTDINAHESFLETASARESILRLARFISYNPRRNQCAQGILKIVEVATDDDVYDGFGVNLNSTTIKWDNPDDPDWFERFVLILNNAFLSTNQFGVPLKSGIVANAKTQLYRLNNLMSEANLGFKAKVSGTSMDFEAINPDFDDGGGFYERSPNDQNALNLFYRNDGNGNSSTQTGFFLMFKQGTSQSSIFNIATPVENNVLDVATTSVNDTDVWVQTVSDAGTVLLDWSKVPAIFSENITYNNYDTTVRNIFSVITRDQDAVSIRFSDGRFGAVPVGNLKVTYRVSNGLQYLIRPADLNRIKLTIPYYNRRGVKKNLTVTFSLQESVTNSVPRETDDQIRARAPSVYATQNRMVSGEDYNTFPLQSNLAVKLKALNRVYSGHSRFIDLNDPTGTYQDVDVFSDDGSFFLEDYNLYTEVPLSLNESPIGLVSGYIQPMLERTELANFMQQWLLENQQQPASSMVWTQASVNFAETGYFSTNNTYLLQGSAFLMQEGSAEPRWATIATILGDPTVAPPSGSPGPVTLSVPMQSGANVLTMVPSFNAGLTQTATSAITDKLSQNRSFTIWYDFTVPSNPWSVQDSSSIMADPTVSGTAIKIMSVDYTSGNLWAISTRGQRYVFESAKKVQWYNDGRKATDADTGLEAQDIIRISRINLDLNDDAGHALPQDYDLVINRLYLNRDGSANPFRVTVNFDDANLNGAPDIPDLMNRVISENEPDTYLFWQNNGDGTLGPLANTVAVFTDESLRANAVVNSYPIGTLAFQIDSPIASRKNTFWLRTAGAGTSSDWTMQRLGTYTYGVGRGPNVGKSWTGPVQPLIPSQNPAYWQEFTDATPVWVTPAGSLLLGASIGSGNAFGPYQFIAIVDGMFGIATYSLVSGALPTGLTLTSSGLLTGTITASGQYNFTIQATGATMTANRTFTMTVI